METSSYICSSAQALLARARLLGGVRTKPKNTDKHGTDKYRSVGPTSTNTGFVPAVRNFEKEFLSQSHKIIIIMTWKRLKLIHRLNVRCHVDLTYLLTLKHPLWSLHHFCSSKRQYSISLAHLKQKQAIYLFSICFPMVLVPHPSMVGHTRHG